MPLFDATAERSLTLYPEPDPARTPDNAGDAVRDDAAGYLNDPMQAKAIVLQGGDLGGRTCRYCNAPLVRAPRGAIVCSGFCDVPGEDPNFTRQVMTGQE